MTARPLFSAKMLLSWALKRNCENWDPVNVTTNPLKPSSVADPLVHHGWHFGCTVHALCNIHALLTDGVLCMVELADWTDKSFTAELICSPTVLSFNDWMLARERQEHKVYLTLMQSIPGLEKRLLTGSNEELILHHAPLIPAGMNPFHWNLQESAGMTQESTGMGRNPQEWNLNGQEWHWNGLKWTFWSLIYTNIPFLVIGHLTITLTLLWMQSDKKNVDFYDFFSNASISLFGNAYLTLKTAPQHYHRQWSLSTTFFSPFFCFIVTFHSV